MRRYKARSEQDHNAGPTLEAFEVATRRLNPEPQRWKWLPSDSDDIVPMLPKRPLGCLQLVPSLYSYEYLQRQHLLAQDDTNVSAPILDQVMSESHKPAHETSRKASKSPSFSALNGLVDTEEHQASPDCQRRPMETLLSQFLADIKYRENNSAESNGSSLNLPDATPPSSADVERTLSYTTGMAKSVYDVGGLSLTLDKHACLSRDGSSYEGSLNAPRTLDVISSPTAPIPRTKADLVEIDRFIEELHAIVYETNLYDNSLTAD